MNMSDAARYIRNDLKETVVRSIRDTENLTNELSSSNIRNRSDADDAKNDILLNLRGIRSAMDGAFDRAESRVERSMSSMNREQQRDLREAVDEVGGFVNRFTRLIKDVCEKVINFFLRSLDRIKNMLLDLKDTIKECCSEIRNCFRGW